MSSSEKREPHYNYLRFTPTNLAVGDTLVWNGVDWVNSPPSGGPGGTGDVTGAANVGSGTGTVFRDEVAGVLNLKTLLAGTNITLTNNANDVTIASAAGTGEANLAANVGTGTGTIFRDKTSVTLNLKTLLAGTGITITNNINDITLASTGGGSTTLDGLTDVAITSAARGDIIVRDATQYVNKAKGTANQVLKMDSAGTDPAWASQVSVYDYILYKVGSEYRIYKTDTGTVLSTSTTDCAALINAAITDMDVYGGTIYVKPGKYTCTTTIQMLADTVGSLPSPPSGAGSGGVNIVGNGYGSWLDWSPGSALTDAIYWSINGSKMESLRLVCNSNVTNYLHVVGHASTVSHAGRNAFEHMFFEGATTDTPITGQRGIFNDTATLQGPYFNKYQDCHFFWLDHGYYSPSSGSTSAYFDNCDWDRCNVGIYLNYGQNFGTNLYFQGDATYGTTGLHLGSGAQFNYFQNMTGEMVLTSLPCQTVLLDSGANWNTVLNFTNALANGSNRVSITNNSGANRNILSWAHGGQDCGYWHGRAFRVAGTSSAPTIGFFENTTPVSQRTGIANIATDTIDATYGTPEQNVLTDLRTKVNSIITALEQLGLLATV